MTAPGFGTCPPHSWITASLPQIICCARAVVVVRDVVPVEVVVVGLRHVLHLEDQKHVVVLVDQAGGPQRTE